MSNPKCKHKAFTVYVHPLEGASGYATLQAMTGHSNLSTKPAQFPPVPVSSANPTHSDNIILIGGMQVKLPIGTIISQIF